MPNSQLKATLLEVILSINRNKPFLKKRLGNYFFNIFLYLAILESSFATSEASIKEKNKLPTTPVSVPIDISKKGNKAEIDIRIESQKEKKRLEPEITAFELQFIPYDPRHDKSSKYYINKLRHQLIMIGALSKYFEPNYTRQEKNEIWKDYDHLSKLLGAGFTVNDGSEYGKHIDYPAIPIPNIHLVIISLDDPNKKVVYDRVLEVKKHPQIHGYFIKFLDYIKLNHGRYKVIANITSDASEFRGVNVKLIIGAYFLK